MRRGNQRQERYGAASADDQPLTSQYQLQEDESDSDRSGRGQGSEPDAIFRANQNEAEGNDDEEEDEEEEDFELSLTELLYSSSSYYAIAKPVTLTMTLAALAVVFVNNDQISQTVEQEMTDAYTVWKTDGSSENTGKTLALSLANSLVMVSAICAMTFVIVLLYKLRCMTCLIGYMIFASATLLGFLGGTMLEVAIEVYRLPIDVITFYWFLYNFAIVGVIAVFWSKGVPTFVTQGYLVATAVILAWQLSHFDEWTTWTLLIMLALYDLCAVLTPCGPLRALVNLMSRDDSPAMPGLLYEAELPPDVRRPGAPSTESSQNAPASSNPNEERQNLGDTGSDALIPTGDDPLGVEESPSTEGPLAQLPLAIALVYNLPVVSVQGQSSGVSTSPLLAGDIPEEPSPQQLLAEVTVQLPAQGGRIEKVGRRRLFLERDRHGNPKRTLWLDRHGKVFAEEPGDREDGSRHANTIRLGLGDFIFYSVLVAKAAQHSFATFLSCILVILAGLGGTLILLAVYHHALPALPISIFLGVVFYLLTRAVIEPWIAAIFQQPYYV